MSDEFTDDFIPQERGVPSDNRFAWKREDVTVLKPGDPGFDEDDDMDVDR